MTDDPCRGVRAHAQSLEEEVALMRGVVAALRASPKRGPLHQTDSKQPRWKIVSVAFFAGAMIGALTLIALTRCT